ncbi:MAG: hypothetical protein QXH24_06945 [Candidatus Bathyarchaeia archaeon]
MSEQEIMRRINEKLTQYEELNWIYDEEFIRKLIKRYRIDNWLLWALSARGPLINNFWAKIVHDLRTLSDEGALQHFKDKLRAESEIDLFGYLAELHFSAAFKRREFSVILNPQVDGSFADFKVKGDYMPSYVYFEVKTFGASRKFKENRLVVDTLINCISKENFPFGLFVSGADRVRVNEARKVAKKIIAHLKELNESVYKSRQIKIPIDEDRVIIVEIRPYRVISVIGSLPHFGHKKLKKIFQKALNQLPKDEPGVIIVVRPFEVDEEEIMDALYGKVAIPFYVESRTWGEPFRKTDGFFHTVHRVSAVITARPIITPTQFSWIAIAYNNPLARFPLSLDVFSGVCAKQLVPKNRSGNVIELEWIYQ